MFFSPILVVATNKLSGSLITTVGWAGWLLLPVTVLALAASFVKCRATRNPHLMAKNLESAR